MLKDKLGRPINIGDTVVYLQHSRSSSSLYKDIVTGMTASMVILSNGKKSPDKLVVVDAQIANNHATYPELFI